MSMCHRCLGYMTQHTAIKPYVVTLSPCQTLEVPLCPDLELACQPSALTKAKSWVQVFPCNKNQALQLRLCLWSMLGTLGRLGRTYISFSHLKDPTELFNFQLIQGTCHSI